MCVVSVAIMRTMPTMIIVMVVIMSHLTIFFFTQLVCLVPCCLDKYLKCRVEVYNEYEEYESNDTEYSQKEELHRYNREECNNSRDRKRDNEEDECYNNGTEIEKYHREVESTRNINVSECHASRESKWDERGLVFEYDKELRICKTHVQKEGKDKVDSHDDTDGARISDSEETEEEYIESDDREWLEYSSDIVYLEYREKVSEPVKESLYGSMCFFSTSLPVGIDHLDNSTIRDRLEYHIEEKYRCESNDNLNKVVRMSELREYSKDLIFFLEYIDVCEGDLIDQDHE